MSSGIRVRTSSGVKPRLGSLSDRTVPECLRLSAGLRARHPADGQRSRINGYYPSQKMRRMLPWADRLEADAMTLWDVDPEVSAYTWREKPVQLANSAQSYTPTFLVLMQQRQEFVEVLNERDRGHSAAAEFFEHVAFACLATGAPLRLRYENELRTEPRLTNARLMLAEAAPREGPELRLLIHEILLRSGGRTRLGDIEALLRARGLGRADLFRLLIAGFLSTDLFQPLTNASEIRYAQMEARQ